MAGKDPYRKSEGGREGFHTESFEDVKNRRMKSEGRMPTLKGSRRMTKRERAEAMDDAPNVMRRFR